MRVSFVPLDMEIPLEEQHSGQMDVVLHKLTEDILCLSQLSMLHPELKNMSRFESMEQIEETLRRENPAATLGTNELAALRRVHRLCQFHRNHPECSLVDDPVCVQTLMSRSDIATTLQQCLKNVTSKSGIAVGCPKSTVLLGNNSSEDTQDHMIKQIQDAGLSFPIIVKPLIAAGTKASHAMAILLEPKPHTLPRIITPCLLQEYSNHDSLLYKVYVLGSHVSVHKRRSLPNLPRGRKSRTGFLEFDSQRPYPRLSDFAFEDAEPMKNRTIASSKEGSGELGDDSKTGEQATKRRRQHIEVPRVVVTAEEIQPIVDALKGAFGLELFGFDVLITSRQSSDTPPRMLVVDVNYFPSYKEVRNFPALLAKYLTDQAIESRRMANPLV